MEGLRTALVVMAVFTVGIGAQRAGACTVFHMERDGRQIVAKSYDWNQGDAMVLVNKTGVRKRAFLLDPADRPLRWKSERASITFNQYGRELPSSGMNDAGLVIEVLWHFQAEYPGHDRRPTVNELQWIQWGLDSFSSVAELVAAAPEVRVTPLGSQVHHLACDASGECAVFEYLDGKLHITAGDEMGAHTLTNDSYSQGASYVAINEALGDVIDGREGWGSLDRFARASARVKQGKAPGIDPVDEAFAILESVAMGSYTQWNIVWEPRELRVHFLTASCKVRKTVELGQFDPGCRSRPQMLDIHWDESGDVSGAFTRYRKKANRKMLYTTLSAYKANPFYPAMVVTLASYPDTCLCTE